jgi:hypothetical protein
MGRLAQFVLDFVWATLAERQNGLDVGGARGTLSADLIARALVLARRQRFHDQH